MLLLLMGVSSARPSPTTERPVGLWHLVFPVALATAIITFSSRPYAPAVARAMRGTPDVDKLAHLAAFGLLALLLARVDWVRQRTALGPYLAVLAVSVFGLTDELHQLTVPGRAGDPWDWLADTAGAGLAVVAYVRLPWLRRLLSLRAPFCRQSALANSSSPCA